MQMSETFLVGMLLALGGGFLDAYTYLCRGHVFANAQTGNMVLLGINLAQGNVREALTYVIPIAAFVVGTVAAEVLREKCRGWIRLHWRQLIVLGELFILAAVAFMPVGRLNMTANVLISLVCAMQVQTFRKMKGNAFATTMCTGNLRSGTELLIHFFITGNRELLRRGLDYFGIILFFILGAGGGAILTNVLGQWAVFVVSGILLAVFCLMFVKNE